jgi:hypothetical protein
MSDETKDNPLTITRIGLVMYSDSDRRWWVHNTYRDSSLGIHAAFRRKEALLEEGLGFDGKLAVVRLRVTEELVNP